MADTAGAPKNHDANARSEMLRKFLTQARSQSTLNQARSQSSQDSSPDAVDSELAHEDLTDD